MIVKEIQSITKSRDELKEIRGSPLDKFGRVVGILRKARKLSIEKLAEKSGVEVEVLTNLECGKILFEEALALLPSLSKALGVSKRTLIRVMLELGETRSITH